MLLLNKKDKIQFMEDYKKLPIYDICKKWHCGEVSVLETGRKLTEKRKPLIRPKNLKYKKSGEEN